MRLVLKELRESRGMSQRQLAEALGESRRNIEDWERGIRLPQLDKAVRMAEFFGIHVERLIDTN